MVHEVQQWFAMRDLKRPNAKMRAYEMLQGKVARVYTPMIKKDIICNGKHNLIDVPYIPDLLFVYDYKSAIDPIVETIPTFQYRFSRIGTHVVGGGGYKMSCCRRQRDGAVHPCDRRNRQVPLLHHRRGLPRHVWPQDSDSRR